ncbi:MAG: hypothetical protein H0U63_03035 [Burkholderiales bacterium]|nr:hypothetical protein [Burkholderiales bacterium]
MAKVTRKAAERPENSGNPEKPVPQKTVGVYEQPAPVKSARSTALIIVAAIVVVIVAVVLAVRYME